MTEVLVQKEGKMERGTVSANEHLDLIVMSLKNMTATPY